MYMPNDCCNPPPIPCDTLSSITLKFRKLIEVKIVIKLAALLMACHNYGHYIMSLDSSMIAVIGQFNVL